MKARKVKMSKMMKKMKLKKQMGGLNQKVDGYFGIHMVNRMVQMIIMLTNLQKLMDGKNMIKKNMIE